MNNRVFVWIAVATCLLLLVPFIAMQLTPEVNWSLSDFIIMGGLLFVSGSSFVLIARKTQAKHRILVGVLVLALTLYIWAELAVGIFTNLGS
ncbi:hypothetical protein EYQ95_04445 [Lysobacter sp. N42]|nr:hypothetical protein DQX04_00855 [Aliidiomarina sp. B3213]TCZ93448.1 hypothetical protein EYQ95_04445 [Lysobacter sp. N42]